MKLLDHRELGQKQNLFFFSEDAPGMPYWLPKGLILYEKLLAFIDQIIKNQDYIKVSGPSMNSQRLLEKSGHWQKYQDDMFVVHKSDEYAYGLKAMNCPNAINFYKHKKRSYKELPLRFADFSLLYRNEASGALSGLMRVQQFRQDDAHIFLPSSQVGDEIQSILAMAQKVYEIFGLSFKVRVGGRPAKRVGSDKIWDESEKRICDVLDRLRVCYEFVAGDGAFYGPKIDLLVNDINSKSWQLGSVQLDYLLPERFSCRFVNQNGKAEQPVLIHRAVLGSVERFLGIYLEHSQGILPFWLSPEQVRVIPVAAKFSQKALQLNQELIEFGLYSACDNGSQSMSAKVRSARVDKVPIVVCLGQRDLDDERIRFSWKGEERSFSRGEGLQFMRQLNQLPYF